MTTENKPGRSEKTVEEIIAKAAKNGWVIKQLVLPGMPLKIIAVKRPPEKK